MQTVEALQAEVQRLRAALKRAGTLPDPSPFTHRICDFLRGHGCVIELNERASADLAHIVYDIMDTRASIAREALRGADTSGGSHG